HYHRLGEEGPNEEPTTPYRVPVFSAVKDQLSCRYQRAGIAAGHRSRGVPLTDEDIAAFNLFDEIAKAPENRLAFYLERGEMMVINNYTVMHARSQFENYPEPERQARELRLQEALCRGSARHWRDTQHRCLGFSLFWCLFGLGLQMHFQPS